MEDIYITVIPKYGHANGAFTFYGQTNEGRSNCQALQNFLANYAGSISSSQIAGVPQTGELVLASIGQAWFRAVMLVCSSAYECNVRLIDHGTEEIVPLPNIRQACMLDSQLRKTVESCPALAGKYTLHGLLMNSEALGESAYSIATQLLLKQTIRAQIVSQNSDSTAVILLCEQGLVSDILSRYGIGTSAPPKPVPTMDMPPPSARPQLPRTPQTAPLPVQRLQYSSLELDERQTYSVVVSFIEQGPLKFTIQEKQSGDALQSLVDKLTQYPRLQPLRIHDSGHPCAARSATDGNIYRGLIIKSEPRGTATVYFVDYGNKELLSAERVYELPVEFLSTKLFSIRSALHGIDTVHVDEEMKRRFDEITENKTLECKVKQSYPLEVALFLNGRSILDLLVQPQTNGRSSASTPSSNSGGNLESYDKLDIQSGFVGEVVVSDPESPSAFYVIKESEVESIRSFEDFINAPNNVRSLRQMPASQMTALTPCLAAFGDNPRYVRGLIMEDPGEPIVAVKAVDSGKTDTVPIDCIRQIKKEIIGIMAAQAIYCVLSGFEDKPASREVIEEFRNLVSNKILKMSIKKLNAGKAVVELTEPANGQSISQILLAVLAYERSGSNRSGRVPPTKPVGNPAPLSLNQVESVYVMLVYDEGKFFAQLERLSSDDLEKMQTELHSVYTNNYNPQLLYADVKSHVGDFAVVKFPEDQAFYRAKINKEIAQDVEVIFIDYGIVLTVDRSEILKPVSMKHWNFQPFGQHFQFESETQISKEDLTASLLEKSIEVQILRQDKSVVTCKLSESPKNEGVSNAILHFKRNAVNAKGSVFSRLGDVPRPLPATNERTVAQERSQREEREPRPYQEKRQTESQDKWASGRSGGGDQRDTARREEKPAPSSGGWDSQSDSRGGPKGYDKPPRFQKTDDGWGAGGGVQSAPSGDRGGGDRAGRDGGGGRGGRDGGRSGYSEGGKDFGSSNGDGGWGASAPAASASKGGWSGGSSTPAKAATEEWGATTAAAPVIVKPVLKLKPINLAVGEVKKCQVVFVSSPKEFYVQLEENIPSLDQLMNDLADFFANDRPAMSDVKANSVCAAMFADDETWYRGLIEKVSGGKATVYFVDYGNRQDTPVSELKDLEAEHVKLPAQACKCALSLVKGGEELKEDFEAQTIEKSLSIKVVAKDKATRTFVVNLKEGDVSVNAAFGAISVEKPFSGQLPVCVLNVGVPTNVFVSYYEAPNNFSLAETAKNAAYDAMSTEMNSFYRGLSDNEMASDGVAGSIVAARFADDDQWNRASVEVANGKNVTVCFLDYGNKGTISGMKDIRGLHSKFTALPIRAVPCKLKGVVVPDTYKPGPVEAKLLAKSSLKAVLHPKESGVYPVELTSDGADVANALIDARVVSKEPDRTPIEVITDVLAGELDSLTSAPHVGDLVAAVFDEDGLFYRAKITEIDDGNASVLFIDYGNDSVVPTDQLKQVPERIRAMSPQLEEEIEVVEAAVEKNTETAPEEADLPIDIITAALAEDLEALTSEPEMGDNVAAVFDEDGLYYRAQIMECSEDTVSVLFIDYGNSGKALISDLKQIPQSVRDFPPQLEPQIVSSEDENHIAHAEPDIIATAQAEVVEPVAENDDEQRILDALVEELSPLKDEVKVGSVIAAVFKEDGAYYRARVKTVIGEEAFVVFIDYGNEDNVDIADMREIPESVRDIAPLFQELAEEQEVPVVTGEEDIDSLVYENSRDESLVSENAWEALRAAFEIPPEPATEVFEGQLAACMHDGRLERIRIVALQDERGEVNLIDIGKSATVPTSEIYQLPEAIKDIPPLFKTDNEVAVEEQAEDSSEVLETIATALEEELVPYEGDVATGKLVAAAFEDDGLFYRAQVKEVNDEDVNVYFIDYGNAGTAKMDELKEIPVSIRNIPAQHAIPNLVDSEEAVNTISTNNCDPSDKSSFQSVVPQEVIEKETQGSDETVTCIENAQGDEQLPKSEELEELSEYNSEEAVCENKDDGLVVPLSDEKIADSNLTESVLDDTMPLSALDDTIPLSALDDTIPFEVAHEEGERLVGDNGGAKSPEVQNPAVPLEESPTTEVSKDEGTALDVEKNEEGVPPLEVKVERTPPSSPSKVKFEDVEELDEDGSDGSSFEDGSESNSSSASAVSPNRIAVKLTEEVAQDVEENVKDTPILPQITQELKAPEGAEVILTMDDSPPAVRQKIDVGESLSAEVLDGKKPSAEAVDIVESQTEQPIKPEVPQCGSHSLDDKILPGSLASVGFKDLSEEATHSSDDTSSSDSGDDTSSSVVVLDKNSNLDDKVPIESEASEIQAAMFPLGEDEKQPLSLEGGDLPKSPI